MSPSLHWFASSTGGCKLWMRVLGLKEGEQLFVPTPLSCLMFPLSTSGKPLPLMIFVVHRWHGFLPTKPRASRRDHHQIQHLLIIHSWHGIWLPNNDHLPSSPLSMSHPNRRLTLPLFPLSFVDPPSRFPFFAILRPNKLELAVGA